MKKFLSLVLVVLLLLTGLAYQPAQVLADNAPGFIGESVNEPLGHYQLVNQTTGETFLAYCADRNKDYPKGSSYTELSAADITDPMAKAIIWNGYPYDKAGFKAQKGLTDGEFQTVTQNALWYYWQKKRGNFHSMGANVSRKVSDAYFDFIYEQNLNLIGLPSGASQLKNFNFQKQAPAGLKLRVYEDKANPEAQRLVIPSYDERPAVKIAKVNTKGQMLAGAILHLQEGDNSILDWTSSQDLAQEIPLDIDKQNPSKEYVLTETTAPAGYELMTKPLKFKVTRKPIGNHVIQIWQDSFNEYGPEESLSESYVLKVKNFKARKAFNFSKKSNAGEVLTDVTYKIINNDDGAVEYTLISKSNPDTVQLQLDTKYTIVETKPKDGYAPFKPIEIKVTNTGAIEPQVGRAQDIKVSGDKVELYNSKTAVTCYISKVNQRGNDISGAIFDVYISGDDDTIVYNQAGDKKKMSDYPQVTEAGISFSEYVKGFVFEKEPLKLIFDEDQMIKTGKDVNFYIIERELPQGYEYVDNGDHNKKIGVNIKVKKSLGKEQIAIEDPLAFTVEYKDGSYSDMIVSDEAGKYFKSDPNDPFRFYIINKKLNEDKKTVTVKKVDGGTGQRLANVQFTIPMSNFDNGRTEGNKSFTTGANGEANVDLIPDTYLLKETANPDQAYRLIEDITFTINDQGQLTIDRDPSAVATVEGNVITIKNVKDYNESVKAPVVIAKYDVSNNLVKNSGIRFSFQKTDTKEDAVIEDGFGKISLVPGIYKVSENLDPSLESQYDKIKDFIIEVHKDGSVTVVGKDASDDIHLKAGTQNQINVINRHKPQTVTIAKVNAANAQLKGAKIEIKDQSGKDTVAAFISGQPETVSLNPGTYTFHEESAPQGYITCADFKFQVGTNGQVTLVEPQNHAKAEGQTLTVTDNQELKTVKFSKQNLAGAEIPGAEIKLSKDNKEVIKWTSEANVTKEVELEVGTYTFEETVAAPGYEVVTSFDFSVDKYNRIEITKANSGNISRVGDKIIILDDYQDAKEAFTFSKQDMGGKEIAGAEITISKDGQAMAKWISEAGKSKQLKLPAGNYSFIEKAPSGYKTVTTTFNFAINEQGEITVPENQPNLEYNKETRKLVLKNELDEIVNPKVEGTTKEIKVSKVDLGGTEVAGALIEIRQNGEVKERWESTTETRTVNLAPGNYTLHEEAAPSGYLKVTDIDFAVNGDGQVTVTNHPKAQYKDGKLQIINEDMNPNIFDEEKIQTSATITFSKTAVNGSSELEGAKLRVVKGETADGAEVRAWTSSKEMQKLTLAPGIYTMIETTAPNGYEVAENITFKVTDDFKLEIKVNDKFVAPTSAEAMTVRMQDAESKVATKSIHVQKKWQGQPATEIIVNLMQNDQLYASAKLSAYNGWSHTFNLLPIKDGPFTASKDYKYEVQEAGAENNAVSIDGRTYKVEITNSGDLWTITNSYQQQAKAVKIAKLTKDSNGEQPLAGAKLQVTRIKDAEGKPLETGESQADWTFTSSETAKELTLPEGEYVIEELAAPKDYLNALPIIFRVSKAGKLEVAAIDASTGYQTFTSVEDDTIKLFNSKTETEFEPNQKNAATKMKVVKKWVGKAKSQVTLELYKQIGTAAATKVKDVVLNETNQWSAQFLDLPTVEMVKAGTAANGADAAGADANGADAQAVTYRHINYFVKEQGQSADQIELEGDTYKVKTQVLEQEVAGSTVQIGYEFTNTYTSDVTKEIKFEKVMGTTRELLADAKLQITRVKDENGQDINVTKPEWQWTTNGQDSISLTLPVGEYVFEEIEAPRGYIQAKPLRFRINYEGVFQLGKVFDKHLRYEDASESKVTMRNYKVKSGLGIDDPSLFDFKVKKIWATKEVPTSPVTIELYSYIDDQLDKATKVESKTLVLSPNNNWSEVFKDLPAEKRTEKDGLITYHRINYFVKEAGTEADNSVEIDGKHYGVGIEMVDDPDSTSQAKGIFEITNTYKSASQMITFSKKAVNGTDELPGASLKIVAGDSNDSNAPVIDTWVSSNVARQVELPEGIYTMIETTAPKGYLVAESISFKVTAAGTIEIKGQDGTYQPQSETKVQMLDKLKPIGSGDDNNGGNSYNGGNGGQNNGGQNNGGKGGQGNVGNQTRLKAIPKTGETTNNMVTVTLIMLMLSLITYQVQRHKREQELRS